jgi:CelD/BcsL family acetyltransferase involved in cellulose biosynthesis
MNSPLLQPSPFGVPALPLIVPASKEPATPAAKKNKQPAEPQKQKNEPDLPLFEFTYRFTNDLEELQDLEPAWQRLVATAIEPNVFHEPTLLLPALRQLANDEQVEVLLIEAPKRVFPAGPRVLCGLIPIVRRRTIGGLPLKSWEVWRHPYSFLGTPLLRRDCAREVLDYLFQIAAQVPRGARAIHFSQIPGEGPLARLLIDSNDSAQRVVFVKDLQTRAMFERDTDDESFLKNRLSKNKRNYMQRIERRLAETGEFKVSWFGDGDDIGAWGDEFLRLEATGWKGDAGSALASTTKHAAFFRELLQRAAAAGTLLLGKLQLNGQPIAMICNFLATDHDGRTCGYSFKIGHDVAFEDYSPGVLMELALIRELHCRGIEWMDSCANSEHSMINPLWPSRTVRQSLVISTGSRRGDLALALMPLLRWGKNLLKRQKTKPSPAGQG